MIGANVGLIRYLPPVWVARKLLSLSADILFGPAEDFEYVSMTAPAAPPPY